jgi:tetratricopeptide (TPR) repeat protein
MAMIVISKAWAQAPGPVQLFQEAVAAQRRGDDAAAVRDYQELIEKHQDAPQVRANLGAALVHLGRFDEAIEQYRIALSKEPGNAQLGFNLALAYYKKGDFPTAAGQFKTLRGGDPRVDALLGDCYSQMGNNTEAIAVLAPISETHPEDLTVAWLLGSALIRAGRTQDGLKQLEKVAESGQSAEAHLLAGQTLLRLNEFEKAQRHADAAVRLNPQLPGAYTLQGQTLQYLGDHKGAAAALNRAIDANPNDFDAHVTLGAILNGERDLEGARKHLDRAVELKPDSALARFELARVERSQGQLTGALKDFEKVVQDNPGWLQPHIDLSALYYKLNRPEDGQRERAIVEKLTAEAPSQ